MDYKNNYCEDCKKRTFKCEEDVNELLEMIEDATEKFYTKRGYRLFL
jgi:cell division septum initiation protein DivIVA